MKVKFDLRVEDSESLEEVLNALKGLHDRTGVDMEVGLRIVCPVDRTVIEVVNGVQKE